MYVERPSEDPLVLKLIVGREPGVRRRPRLRVEAAMDRPPWRSQLIRIVNGTVPLLWAARSSAWDEHPTFLRGDLPERAGVLPAVTQGDFRACTERPRTPGWWDHWLRYFAGALGAATEGILQPGAYALAALSRPLDVKVEALTTVPPLDRHGAIDFIRRPSRTGDRRVEMWRKRAAAGIPPALFYDWICEPGPLLIDGHDRLLAMALEGVPQLALKLTPIAFGGETRRLTGSTSWGGTSADHRYAVGRLHPLPGGADAWRREVRERLWAVRDALGERSWARTMLD